MLQSQILSTAALCETIMNKINSPFEVSLFYGWAERSLFHRLPSGQHTTWGGHAGMSLRGPRVDLDPEGIVLQGELTVEIQWKLQMAEYFSWGPETKQHSRKNTFSNVSKCFYGLQSIIFHSVSFKVLHDNWYQLPPTLFNLLGQQKKPLVVGLYVHHLRPACRHF